MLTYFLSDFNNFKSPHLHTIRYVNVGIVFYFATFKPIDFDSKGYKMLTSYVLLV